MFYELETVSVIGVLCVIIGSRGVIRVLLRLFYGFRGVTTEVSATFRAEKGGDSFRFHRREGIDHDIFDPVGVVTRTAAVAVPIARPGEGFVRWQIQRFVLHRAIPHLQTIRTL